MSDYSAFYGRKAENCPLCGSTAAGQYAAAPSASSANGGRTAGYIPGMPVQAQQRQETAAGFYSPVPQLESMQGGVPAGYNAVLSTVQTQPGGTGSPSAGAGSAAAPGQLSQITDVTQPPPMTTDSLQYLNGFLRSQIGRRVRVEFLLGTNTMTDKTGTLLGVGANYILLREANSDDLLVCDFYNIKFVTVFY